MIDDETTYIARHVMYGTCPDQAAETERQCQIMAMSVTQYREMLCLELTVKDRHWVRDSFRFLIDEEDHRDFLRCSGHLSIPAIGQLLSLDVVLDVVLDLLAEMAYSARSKCEQGGRRLDDQALRRLLSHTAVTVRERCAAMR